MSYDISIIIPTNNNVKYLDESLNSIISSAKGLKYEILVGIDNCRKTLEYISKNYEKYDENVKFFFFQRSLGPYIIRNTLVKDSSSDNLFFFDSDDIATENLVNEIYSGLTTHDSVRYRFWNFVEPKSYKDKANLSLNRGYSDGQFGIRKKIFLEQNGFEPWVCAADSEFAERIRRNKFSIKYIDTPMIYRRQHGENLTLKKDTGWNSKVRNHYVQVRNFKVKNNIFKPLDKLTVSSYIRIHDKFNVENFFNSFQVAGYEKGLLFSIIIPTFDNLEYFDECVQSVVNSIKNLECEVLIGIDGCRKTLDYVKSKIFDERFKIFYFDNNVGPYIVRNTLVSKSKSQKILFFDSDDVMLENMVQEFLEFSDKTYLYKPMYLDFKDKSEIKTLEKTTNKFGEGVFGINRDIFLKLNGFEGWKCAADSDFMARLYKNHVTVSAGSKISFLRRIHPKSLTSHPDTNYSSKLRAYYYGLGKKKRPNGVCEIFSIEKCKQIELQYREKPISDEKIQKNRAIDALKKISLLRNTNPKPVNYSEINKQIERKGVYNINSSQRPIRQNIPNKRQELIDLKKESNTKQIREISPGKPNRRNNLPNIF